MRVSIENYIQFAVRTPTQGEGRAGDSSKAAAAPGLLLLWPQAHKIGYLTVLLV